MEWPITSGNYVVGDTNSSVAVVTLASDYKEWGLKNYAICGTCFTANFGIEKIITNVLANPNINYLVVCGRKRPLGRSVPGLTCRKWSFYNGRLKKNNRFKIPSVLLK